jgi:hypothetical protein
MLEIIEEITFNPLLLFDVPFKTSVGYLGRDVSFVENKLFPAFDPGLIDYVKLDVRYIDSFALLVPVYDSLGLLFLSISPLSQALIPRLALGFPWLVVKYLEIDLRSHLAFPLARAGVGPCALVLLRIIGVCTPDRTFIIVFLRLVFVHIALSFSFIYTGLSGIWLIFKVFITPPTPKLRRL